MAKEDRGFASMDREKQREIASKGGRAAHVKGTAHEWSAEEARAAGRKGGLASHKKRRPPLHEVLALAEEPRPAPFPVFGNGAALACGHPGRVDIVGGSWRGNAANLAARPYWEVVQR